MNLFNSSSDNNNTDKANSSGAGDNHFFKAQSDSRINDQYYDLAKARDNWRNMSFLLVLVSILFLGAYLWKSMQSDTQPFVYHEDASGELIAMGYAEPTNINNDQQVKAHIYKVLDHLRTVYSDEKVMEDRLKNIFQYYLSAESGAYLNKYFSDSSNDPRNIAKRYSRSIDIQGIIPTSQDGKEWKVRWIETLIASSDRPIEKQAWEAFITIDFQPLNSQHQARINPLGMVVSSISWGPITPSTENN